MTGPKAPALRRALPVAAIVAVGFALFTYGIHTGLPYADSAYSMDPDEWTPLRALRGMHPGALDFNPHYFDNPTLFYYLLGACFAVARAVGLVHLQNGEAFLFAHPEQVARLLLIGRLAAATFAAGGVWLTYLLARRCGLGRPGAALASALLAIHPSFVVQAHFMAVNAAVAFWFLATLLLLDRWLRRGGAGAAALAGTAAGIACSTKYSGLLLIPIVIVAAAFRARGGAGAAPDTRRAGVGRELAAAAVCVPAAFLAGSPYLVLAGAESRALIAWLLHSLGIGVVAAQPAAHAAAEPGVWSALRWVAGVHFAASGPLLIAAALAGLVLALRRPTPLRVLVVTLVVVFFGVSLRMKHLATDSRFLPMFPLLAVLAAIALSALVRARRAFGAATLAALALTQGAWTGALLARFHGPLPQRLASEWARDHLPAHTRILLAGAAVYWSPDLPLREYLQRRHPDAYSRRTQWEFVAPDSFGVPYTQARRERPDVVMLCVLQPFIRHGLEWLSDPDYEVAASFPGKVRLFGRRVHAPLDLFDVDLYVLRRRQAAGAAAGPPRARAPAGPGGASRGARGYSATSLS